MNNMLDLKKGENQLFVACVLSILCEDSPLVIDISKIKKYWDGEYKRLQYNLEISDEDATEGFVTFSLEDKQ